MDRIQPSYSSQKTSQLVAAQYLDDDGTFCTFSNRVVCLKEIGSGLFSHVYLGTTTVKEKGLPERFAVKIFDKWGCDDERYFNAEVKALTLLKECPFIVDIFTSYIDNYRHILLELGDIDLNDLVVEMIKQDIKLTEGNLNFILDNLSRAAEFMLESGVGNNDLLEYNVVYFFNQSCLKFIDFNKVGFDVPPEENGIMKCIGLIIVYCKLRESHNCQKESRYDCNTCKDFDAKYVLEFEKFVDKTRWRSRSFHALIRRLTKLDPSPPVVPSQLYKSLGLIEILPPLTRT